MSAGGDEGPPRISFFDPNAGQGARLRASADEAANKAKKPIVRGAQELLEHVHIPFGQNPKFVGLSNDLFQRSEHNKP